MILDVYESCNADSGCKDRWNRWKQHRENIGTALERCGEAEKVVILGAGRCEDLDLKHILKSFGHITLVDYDFESMKKALDRQMISEGEAERITLVGELEFTGLYDEEFLSYDGDDIEYFDEMVMKSGSSMPDILGREKYDLVISGAVHSQLIMPYVELAKNHEQGSDLMGKAGMYANILAEKYNENMMSLLRAGGKCVCYYDVMEFSRSRGTLPYTAMFDNQIMGTDKDREAVLEELIAQYGGVAGGRHGYDHMIELGKISWERNWLWKYREDKQYYVRCIIVEKEI